MRVYLKNGKSIRVKKELGEMISDVMNQAITLEGNPDAIVRYNDNSFAIRVSEVVCVK